MDGGYIGNLDYFQAMADGLGTEPFSRTPATCHTAAQIWNAHEVNKTNLKEAILISKSCLSDSLVTQLFVFVTRKV